MDNQDLAAMFSEIADLMEILGRDRFRINSYRRAARTLDEATENVADLAEAGTLGKLPGFGKHTQQRIEQYLQTGKIDVLEELRADVPTDLPGLLQIPGVGPKTLALAWKKLGVTDLTAFQSAVEDGSLAALPGLGEKKIAQFRQGLEFREKAALRRPLGLVLPVGLELAQSIRRIKGVRRVELAGSVRRAKETIGDLDLLVEAPDGAGIVEKFLQLPHVTKPIASGQTRGSAMVVGDIHVDIRVVPCASFGAALLYFTGSKEHNVRLRELALKRKWKLNEYGLFDANDKPLAGKDEKKIYTKLDLPWIPPELREDRGEIEAAQKNALPHLIERADVRGDLHTHSTWSDGRVSIEDMARAAKRRGYQYIAITDHSRASAIANGLTEQRVLAQLEELEKVRKRVSGIRIFSGTEVDILADGRLDFSDDLLGRLDFVIASIHSAQGQSREKITARLLAACRNPYVHCIGHPTGRLLGERRAMEVDMEQVISEAARTGTAMELNAHWIRLDLKDVHLLKARRAGVKIAINTDAHAPEQLDNIAFGLATARRGWLEKGNVLNCLGPDELEGTLKS